MQKNKNRFLRDNSYFFDRNKVVSMTDDTDEPSFFDNEYLDKLSRRYTFKGEIKEQEIQINLESKLK